MNVQNFGPVQVCEKCGQQWMTSHYCPASNRLPGAGAKPLLPLTEDDVRRIVREELAKSAQKQDA